MQRVAYNSQGSWGEEAWDPGRRFVGRRSLGPRKEGSDHCPAEGRCQPESQSSVTWDGIMLCFLEGWATCETTEVQVHRTLWYGERSFVAGWKKEVITQSHESRRDGCYSRLSLRRRVTPIRKSGQKKTLRFHLFKMTLQTLPFLSRQFSTFHFQPFASRLDVAFILRQPKLVLLV